MQFLKTILIAWPAVAVLLISGLFPLSAQRITAGPEQVKAAFLINFTRFVEWPAAAFPDGGAPIVIGVVGEDPFGAHLDELVAGEEVNGHPLVVRRFGEDDGIGNCHILYINVVGKNKAAGIVVSIKGKSILTVGEEPGFLYNGGMIRLVTVENKIKFKINPEAAKSVGLVLSSRLLQLAEIVSPPNKTTDGIK